MKDELKSAVDQMVGSAVSFKDAVAEFKKRYIQRALESNDLDAKRAAKALGMNRDSLRSKAKKYKLKLKKKSVKPPQKKGRKKKA